ncbi:putative bifunctional diguanylate cyclase/phosphodiesterase [Lachnoclostridium phytofermentans]|uniref:putative bifunctional diguanylate cyclase/phosphodiesterase n=1 Tax=Lachnoclostridium phytofermentans TaxID=66219 RepID=UPI000674BF09|nr:EAL domain-containing protein [Lachnoclostridium phytofermentans]
MGKSRLLQIVLSAMNTTSTDTELILMNTTADTTVNQIDIGSGRNLLYILLVTIVVFLIFFLLLFVNIRKRTKAEKAAINVNQKLKESNKELEKALSEVTATKDALHSKYEELKKSKEIVKRMAYSDYLTSLPNRLAFVELLDGIMATIRQNEIVGILDIDIDNFKDINDTLGHSYGDEMLIDVMHRLEELIKENDYLSRIGGDEFAILIQNLTDLSELEERILEVQQIFATPFRVATREFFITVSIGVAIAPKDGKTTQSLVKNMNSAMYEAKERGKNNFCYYDDSINLKMMQKLEMQSELRKAIEENQFVVYYQPQINLVNDRVVGFEALARWQHPEKGIIAPIDFIPLAEDNGMIVAIGKKMLYESCMQLRSLQESGYRDIVIAVNLSARQFKDKDFLPMVYEILEETKADARGLEFEITETVALDDLEFSISTISKLKEIGITFALDDFGTGYSSLNYLKRLPVNNLKIDKSFLDTILENNSDQKIVHTMIDLAKHLNIEVIAEGVELSEQEKFLKEINCGKAQGYYYGKPVPKEIAFEILKKLNSENS